MKRGMMITGWEDLENPRKTDDRNLKPVLNKDVFLQKDQEIKPTIKVSKIQYAIGFFLATNFAGKLLNGMKFYLTNNQISRLCRVEIKAIVSIGEEIVSNDQKYMQRGDIAFLRIFPVEDLIIDDPVEFPEFSLLTLSDNCQQVAIGKLFKIVREGDPISK